MHTILSIDLHTIYVESHRGGGGENNQQAVNAELMVEGEDVGLSHLSHKQPVDI